MISLYNCNLGQKKNICNGTNWLRPLSSKSQTQRMQVYPMQTYPRHSLLLIKQIVQLWCSMFTTIRRGLQRTEYSHVSEATEFEQTPNKKNVYRRNGSHFVRKMQKPTENRKRKNTSSPSYIRTSFAFVSMLVFGKIMLCARIHFQSHTNKQIIRTNTCKYSMMHWNHHHIVYPQCGIRTMECVVVE